MRIVTSRQLQRLEHVLVRAREACAGARTAARTAALDAEVLFEAGRAEEANSAGAGDIARLRLLMTNLGAEFEIAAVGFLGERRRPGEALADYLARINEACSDFSTMLATQRANGLEYRP